MNFGRLTFRLLAAIVAAALLGALSFDAIAASASTRSTRAARAHARHHRSTKHRAPKRRKRRPAPSAVAYATRKSHTTTTTTTASTTSTAVATSTVTANVVSPTTTTATSTTTTTAPASTTTTTTAPAPSTTTTTTTTAAATTSSNCSDLYWPAPTLSSPTTINVPASGGGYYQLDNQRDYTIVLPSTTRVGQLQIDGGRNITIVGGSLKNYTGTGAALLYFTDNGTDGAAVPGRIIHVAHLREDLSVGDERDAIALQTPSAIVQLEDVHVLGVNGAGTQNHSDIVQNYSAVKELRVDRLTGESDYQGFFIRPLEGAIGKVTLRRVNLQLDPNPLDAYSQLLFLSNPDGTTDPISFDQVYVNNTRAGQTAQDAVYPDSTATPASLWDGTQISFPSYPLLQGTVLGGTPPGGNFACA